MISKYTYKDILWIDLESPTDEELIYVMNDHKIPKKLRSETKLSILKSGVSIFDDYIYSILSFPNILNLNKDEIYFIIGKKVILTIHNYSISFLNNFFKNFQIDTIIQKDLNINNAKSLFIYLIKSLYIDSDYQIDSLIKEIDTLTKNIDHYSHLNKIKLINKLDNKIILINKSYIDHTDILNQYNMEKIHLNDDLYINSMKEIIDKFNKISIKLKKCSGLVSSFRDKNELNFKERKSNYLTKIRIYMSVFFIISIISGIIIFIGSFNKILLPYLIILLLSYLLILLLYRYIKRNVIKFI